MGDGGGVVEDMEFLNKMCKLKGSRKGIHRDDQEKIMSTSLGYSPWNFQGVYTTQVLEIPGVKLHFVHNFLG